jgi:diguanylate cyclase (GGDEF)-like protein/PAS domain S-box-containing protein
LFFFAGVVVGEVEVSVMEVFGEEELNTLMASPDMTVGQVVRHAILQCTPDEPLATVAARMSEAGYSSIVVMEDGVPVGIWTEHDALSLDFSTAQNYSRPVSELMSSPVKSVTADTSLQEVASRFLADGVRHYLVCGEAGKPIGMVSQTDIILNQGVEHYLRLRHVSSVLKEGTVVLDAEERLHTAARRMRETGRDAVLVHYSSGDEFGILTERDIVRFIAQRLSDKPAGELASRPLVTISSDCSLYRARDILLQSGVRHLGVLNGELVTGLLSFSDILFGIEHVYVQELRQALDERDRALSMSRRNLRLAERIIDSSLEGVMVTDAEGIIESVNPAFSRLTGYSSDEVIGKTPSILSSGRHDKVFYQTMWQRIREDGCWQGEVWNRRKNGEIFPERLTIAAIHDEESEITHYASLFSDISSLKENEEHIRHLAYYDPLTNLPNRRLFIDRLSVALAHAHRNQGKLAVMFIDLDRFKRINDSLGHSVGDSLLQETASRLLDAVREDDTVARMGGDEFIILLSEVAEMEHVIACARRITEAMGQPIAAGEQELLVSCSIGISIYPDDGSDGEALVKNADTAMYRAKDAGRNNYQLYSPAMNARSLEHLAMELSLHKALERDELEVHYQPLFRAGDGQLVGAEALLRWNHPVLGRVSPADFIPLAEETGLIVPIGEFVLRQVCKQLHQWKNRGLGDINVAVNISVCQFHHKDFLHHVYELLEEAAVDTSMLTFELTESMLMKDAVEGIRIMEALRKMGIGLSVDDFGTGYSSLSYLRRFPINKLKIDRSFIRDIGVNKQGAAIVSAVINLGHSLDLEVVAEGVEEEEQLSFLQQHDCDVIQGFYYSPAVDADTFAESFLQ